MFISTSLWFIMIEISCSYGYENIALNKPTHQSHIYYSKDYPASTFESSNAVDGQKTNLSAFGGQCVISADGYKDATWWVNLTSIHSIHGIRIYYRTDNSPWNATNGYTARFLGFHVYVSNTTNIEDGHLCFHDTKYNRSTIPAVFNTTCPVHGQYVIYYNERPQNPIHGSQLSDNSFNELCEVEVYGCNKTGYYGPDCSLPCPDNCRYCHIETGACQGCKPGYKGHRCELQCGNRTYGDKCMEDCGTCLGYKQCHHLNGSCLEGCDAGYEGDLCKTGCESGKFGINCKGNCNKNCLVPYVCNGTTGECEGGCQPGWEGLHCNKTCRNNRYGSYCNQSCGYCRDDAKCHHINGTCQSGCKQGYRGVNCTTECTLGTFGFDCKENCSKRCFETCNPVNGNCPAIKETSFQISNSVNFGIVISGIVGVIIPCLIVVIVVLVLKRRHSLQKNNSDSERTKTRDKSRKGVPETEFTSHDSNSTSTSSSGNKFSKTRNNNPRKSQKKGDEADVDDDEILHFENPYGDFYANEMTMWDIPLNQLESVITEKRMNENEGFQREYATLPYGELYKCDEGKKEENLVKNRYKTTFPYDHSRVILRTEANSGYINANYIEGSSRNNEYIATQGPKQNTLVDFWTMIWQENVSSIVMLTNLQEGTKMKCSQYWPDISKKNNYGTVNVKLMEEKMYAFYILRRMSVSHNESKKSRTVTQFHYTAWPDHGTPDPICLIVFLDHVNQTKTNQINSPTVIHCSAGLGRTGTYIALDTLEKIGRKTGKVNVAEYVKKMRESRMNMVQTYEQYMTVFLALNEIFKAPINNHTIEDFTRKAGTMTTDEPANHSALRKEFQLLMKIRPIYTDADFKIAKELCRDGPITGFLPLDKYIVYLSTPVTNRGSFINAIYVPSFTNNWAFIVTNYPSEGDAVDFLRLLCEQESSTVICMDPLNEIESCKAWLPSQTSSYNSVPPFTINFQSRTETDVCSLIVHIRQKNVKKPRTVTIIEPRSSIKTSGTPLDTSQFRSLVSAASSAETENPVIVVSSDGAVLCGAFCAVHNVIQQIYMDAMVDVFTNVRQLQVRRPEFCSSLEEYGLVMKAVNDHIQRGTENIYSNQ
ncbi:receptor-type tyrosine-protein phosphatase epsilon-like isoform X1 [Saccostrea cucullata]|uniref:receptor-type tyrosine-protein phosphatase epsilon-like isoform X1 n=1 Tax=Saccostrea cuccullata TaxID=36930 RepID=UPI002ED0EA04